MHAVTSALPFVRPMALVQPVNENDDDTRLIAEVLTALSDLVDRMDAAPVLRPAA